MISKDKIKELKEMEDLEKDLPAKLEDYTYKNLCSALANTILEADDYAAGHSRGIADDYDMYFHEYIQNDLDCLCMYSKNCEYVVALLKDLKPPVEPYYNPITGELEKFKGYPSVKDKARTFVEYLIYQIIDIGGSSYE